LKSILANITSDQAVHILKVLWEKRSDVREIIVNEAERLLGPVDPDEIAEDLFFALESIDVHELWDRSGSHSDGYTSPEDMAMEMVEEEIDQFSDQIQRYHNPTTIHNAPASMQQVSVSDERDTPDGSSSVSMRRDQ
jgi:hypothetical protein